MNTCKRLCAPHTVAIIHRLHSCHHSPVANAHIVHAAILKRQSRCTHLIPEGHGDLAVLRQGSPGRRLIHLQHQHVEHSQAQQVVPR